MLTLRFMITCNAVDRNNQELVRVVFLRSLFGVKSTPLSVSLLMYLIATLG